MQFPVSTPFMCRSWSTTLSCLAHKAYTKSKKRRLLYRFLWLHHGICRDTCEGGTKPGVQGLRSPVESLTWRSSVLQTLALSVVGIGALFSLLFHIGTKENSSFQRLPETDDEDEDPHKPLSRSPKPLLLWKHWLLEPSFYQVH